MTDGDVEPTDLTLDEILTAASDGIPGVARRRDQDGLVWLIDGRPFAAVEAGHAAFHLDPLVAGAALRTPETRTSARGLDWVTFAPAVLDVAAVDRLEAWFLSAARRASRGRGGTSENR